MLFRSAEMKVILAFPGKRTGVYIHDEVAGTLQVRKQSNEGFLSKFQKKPTQEMLAHK